MANEFTATRWGDYTVLEQYQNEGKQCKVKFLDINPNANLSYQYHKHRGESWTVVAGSGTFVQDGTFYEIKPGDTVHIPIQSKHAVKAGERGLEIVEVQFGTECTEEDIIRIYEGWESILRFASEDDH